ncbi:DNA polymerase [Clostridium botulinum]|uniref:DNA polymerase n=1 Tax=Clostridium botulinum TaxID=1491 RepID=UPI0002EDD9F4|nr:DNA polymerase [Clostridium botulinum]KLU76015.1 XRE family transcriptional regulator [Clostridium botulinum V891]KOA72912.1 XRE family transcriptional regulator [Clostridium botulinum]KOA93045.1 XRE family transcriptional regulator [Clostridium botulinum]KOC32182.1 XRE family transcriptional regulator [Clostridium botulinum]MCD3253256.1 DNA polymerase [Clostridium botulinum C/D]
MKILSIDIETFSDLDIGKCGVHRYSDSPNFDILLFGYSIDGGPVEVIDMASGDILPQFIIDAIIDDTVIKTAFNAQFERVCLMRYLSKLLNKNIYLHPSSWSCTEVQASTLGLPLSLAGVGKVLKLDEQKMDEGKALIRYFCTPCRATAANGGRTRNMPKDAPEKWGLFKKYNVRDVQVELAIREKLKKYPIPEKEQEFYVLDQKINDLGLLVDRKLVEEAISCDRQFTVAATEKAYDLTGLENPNSVAQLKGWLKDRGVEVESLSKKAVTDLVEETEGEVAEALKLRLLMAKTSVKKYEAIERAVCSDGRVHGLFQFYGANRTGRWSGRLVQFQNLPQNHLKDLTLARDLIKEGRFEDVELLFGNTPSVLSELIRTNFIPKEKHRFIVADFSAIEARVISWLAGEKWRLDVFVSHGKIYEAAASMMFHVPIESITKGSPLRQKGKISELACGYGGGVGALKSMGALDMGVEESELQGLIDNWRSANPHIVKFWWGVDRMAIKAVKERGRASTHGIIFTYKSGMLFVTLPSGRNLVYVKPRIGLNKFGREGLTYEGIGATKKWDRIETYGPKIVENIVQATSRDLLAEAMLRLDKAGYKIVAHVHDEAICEVPIGEGSVEEMCAIMTESPKWVKALPLKAEGYECSFYMKD